MHHVICRTSCRDWWSHRGSLPPDNRDLRTLMMVIDRFLKQKLTDLVSFAVTLNINDRDSKRQYLFVDDHGRWIWYSLFLKSVLEALNAHDVCDGYLKFGFQGKAYWYHKPEFDHERNRCKYYFDETIGQFWDTIRSELDGKTHEMHEEEFNGPAEIVQLLCRILEKVKDNQRGDRLIVKCIGMGLPKVFRKFMKFWFKDRIIRMRSDETKFIAE